MGVLMGVIVLLGFLIQYPDTVDGQISVTATTAPVRLVANSNGRINLLQTNKTGFKKAMSFLIWKAVQTTSTSCG